MEKLTKATTVRLDQSIDRWYRTEAARQGVSVSSLIRRVLTDRAMSDISSEGMTSAALGRLRNQMEKLTREVSLVSSMQYAHVYTFLLASLAEHGSDGGVGLEFDKTNMPERNRTAAAVRQMADGLMKEWVRKLVSNRNVKGTCIDSIMELMGLVEEKEAEK